MDNEILRQASMFNSLIQEWNTAYEDYARSVGLSYTSLAILSTLNKHPECTQKDLTRICFLPKQTVNAVITSFLKKGWIRLEEKPEDRRNKAVLFTEEGRYQADKILKRVRESEYNAMSEMTEEQRKTLIELTTEYVRNCRF